MLARWAWGSVWAQLCSRVAAAGESHPSQACCRQPFWSAMVQGADRAANMGGLLISRVQLLDDSTACGPMWPRGRKGRRRVRRRWSAVPVRPGVGPGFRLTDWPSRQQSEVLRYSSRVTAGSYPRVTSFECPARRCCLS